jgi:hypothetical protein
MKIKELTESSLNRVYQATRKHDYGTISACRYAPDCGKGQPHTYRENLQRTKSLLAKLRVGGYSVTSIRGSYIENYGTGDEHEVGESSFLVVDIQDKGNLRSVLCRLGEEFDQDSVIFGKAGGDGVLIGTNHCPDGYPGYGIENVQGGAIFGREGEFMSRVGGRPFVFSGTGELTEHAVAKFPTELRGPSALSKKHWSEIPIED